MFSKNLDELELKHIIIFALQSYAFSCVLYLTKQKYEPLTDLEMVMFIEKDMRSI